LVFVPGYHSALSKLRAITRLFFADGIRERRIPIVDRDLWFRAWKERWRLVAKSVQDRVRFLFDDVASVTYMFLQNDDTCPIGQALPPAVVAASRLSTADPRRRFTIRGILADFSGMTDDFAPFWLEVHHERYSHA
jgi:hypothetical protein